MEHRYLQITVNADTAQIRSAKFDGIDHMVVPVVALVGNIIVTPMNSDKREFVPLEELSQVPEQWNNRPVLNLHPNNGSASANDRSVLESSSFGRLFNSRIDDGRLKTEAWIDPIRAAQVGEGAQSVVDRLNDGSEVEISIGAFVSIDDTSGEFDGEPYDVIWRNIRSDHLAMLPENAVGACSIEDGCGAPRANQKSETCKMSDTGNESLSSLKKSLSRPVVDFVRGIFGIGGKDLSACELNDEDVNKELARLLEAENSDFWEVVFVSSVSSSVVYLIWGDGIKFFRRTFSNTNDKITLNDDAVEGALQMKFSPFDDEDIVTTTTNKNNGELSTNKEGENMCDQVEQLIDKLVGNELVGKSDRKKVTSLVEGFKLALESKGPEENPTTTENVVKDTELKVGESQCTQKLEPVKKTDAELIAELPVALRDMVARSQAEEASRRGSLVAYLSKAQSEWSEDVLKEKSTNELQSLATILGEKEGRDFGLQGAPIVDSPVVAEAPRIWTAALEKQAN